MRYLLKQGYDISPFFEQKWSRDMLIEYFEWKAAQKYRMLDFTEQLIQTKKQLVVCKYVAT